MAVSSRWALKPYIYTLCLKEIASLGQNRTAVIHSGVCTISVLAKVPRADELQNWQQLQYLSSY